MFFFESILVTPPKFRPLSDTQQEHPQTIHYSNILRTNAQIRAFGGGANITSAAAAVNPSLPQVSVYAVCLEDTRSHARMHKFARRPFIALSSERVYAHSLSYRYARALLERVQASSCSRVTHLMHLAVIYFIYLYSVLRFLFF